MPAPLVKRPLESDPEAKSSPRDKLSIVIFEHYLGLFLAAGI
jgi:hypothetical protein